MEEVNSNIFLKVNLTKYTFYKLMVYVMEHFTKITLQMSIGRHNMFLPFTDNKDGTKKCGIFFYHRPMTIPLPISVSSTVQEI